MQKTKAVQIGPKSFTLKELPVRIVWDLVNNPTGSDSEMSFADRFQELLALSCPELTTETFLDLYPSEIEELWRGFEEVNAAFLGVVRRVGLDAALTGAVTEVVGRSIAQFASSLPMVMAPSSGSMDTVSS